jgi:hypothetical protein
MQRARNEGYVRGAREAELFRLAIAAALQRTGPKLAYTPVDNEAGGLGLTRLQASALIIDGVRLDVHPAPSVHRPLHKCGALSKHTHE